MLHIHHRKLIKIALIFVISWFIGTILIHHFERGYPIGESYFNALYFTIITTATIGFGDLVPMTVAGKVLTMGYALFYVPLFLYAMNVILQAEFTKFRQDDERLESIIRETEIDVERIVEDGIPKKQSRIERK